MLGPRTAVWVGSLIVAAGVAFWSRAMLGKPKQWLPGLAALAAGTPLWLAPPFFYDALVYHLGMPWSWLVNGSFATVPHHLFSHFPVAASSVFLLPVAWHVPEAAGALHWFSLVVASVALHRLAAHLGAGRLAVVAPVLVACCWHVPWIASQAAADILVLLGVATALEAFADRERSDRWLDIGLACGLAVASKYPGLLPVAGIFLTLFCVEPRRWRTWCSSALVTTGAGCFVYVRNLAVTGNPVFPLAWNLFGGRGWTEDDYRRYSALVREGEFDIPGLASALERLVFAPGGLGIWLLLGLPLAILALIEPESDGKVARRVGVCAAVLLGLWLATAQTPRFAIPFAAVVAVLVAAGVGRIRSRLVYPVLAALAVACLLGVLQLFSFAVRTVGIGSLWTGAESREEWRSRVTINDPVPSYREADSLPAGSRLLIVGEGRSWLCPTLHHASSAYDFQRMQAVVETSDKSAEIAETLAHEGWTHLMINWGEIQRLGGEDYRVLRYANLQDRQRWADFLAKHTTRVARKGPCEIRRILTNEPVDSDAGSSIKPERID